MFTKAIKIINPRFPRLYFQNFYKFNTIMAEATKPKVLFVISDGCEEIETIAPIDILRRAGAEVTIASAMGKEKGLLISGGQSIGIQATSFLEDVQDNEYDLIAIPGGLKNAQYLAECELLIKVFKRQKAANKWYAAICASPALVFQRHGLLDGEVGTCYPSLAEKLADKSQVDSRVVVSNKCITSRGPGTSCEFGLELVKALFGGEKPKTLQDGMLIKA